MTTMNTTNRSTVVGVFADSDDAREAIEALKDDGFTADSISILSPDKQATQEIAEDTGTNAAGSGAATGALAGGILGGLGGWLVGIGALAIPGVGPFIAAGAFATALGGAAIGAGVGAIAGALMGMGVPEEHAKYYEGEAKAGKTLVTVRANTRNDDAQRILREYGAYDVESRDRPVATGSPMIQGGLVANKQTVETGQVHVSPREQVGLQKRARVYDDVGVGKRTVRDTEHVSGTVRREEVHIHEDGDTNLEEAR
jgi:hypothetical protein